MERKKLYYVPDLRVFKFETNSGFAASTELSNSGIKSWEYSEGDDDWFSATN